MQNQVGLEVGPRRGQGGDGVCNRNQGRSIVIIGYDATDEEWLVMVACTCVHTTKKSTCTHAGLHTCSTSTQHAQESECIEGDQNCCM